MTNAEAVQHWKEVGERWKKGEIVIKGWEAGEKKVKLSPRQIEFVNAKDRYCLYGGSFASGKTLALLLKLFLLCVFFPENRILLGRKTVKELEQVTLPDLFDLIPESWFEYRKADGIILFFNKSQIILFGLDALQEGSSKEIKKAEQAIKSLNLGGFFIDQLEEVEERVFSALTGRMRRDVGFQQANMTTNPENYWAHSYFKLNPKPNTKLIEGNMMENKENLPPAFLEDQLSKPESYKRRYVYGEWTLDAFTEGQVFAPEIINTQEALCREPEYEWDGAFVYQEFDPESEYIMGVDPSEGLGDPGAIVISNKNTGDIALVYSDYVPAHVLSEKAVKFGMKYGEALAFPEKNGNGLAVVEYMINRYSNIVTSKVYDKREQKESERVGWLTSVRTKRLLISHFQELLDAGWVKIRDKRIINEMRSFIWSDAVKKMGASAQEGYHDDILMATMMSYYNQEPRTMAREADYESLSYRRRHRDDQPIKPLPVSYR